MQEFCSADNHEEGRVPRTVECELTEDLVDCCIPGEVVMVTGIVKVLNNYMDVGGGRIQSDHSIVVFSINYLLQTSKQQQFSKIS
jgi:DNA helicase MCM8